MRNGMISATAISAGSVATWNMNRVRARALDSGASDGEVAPGWLHL